MKRWKVMLGLLAAGAVLSLALQAQAAHHKAGEMKMDCAAMFNKAEGMLSENKKIAVEKKASMYEMAVKAYKKCKKGEKKEAEDFFKQVFDTSGRM